MDGERSYCLLLGKHRIEMRLIAPDVWEYRILNEHGQYIKAGMCGTEEECRQKVRAMARQILDEAFLTDEHWAWDNAPGP